MTLRLLHTADWQLGKPFAHIAGDTGALLRQARFDTVGRLAQIAQDREVAAVLVAGDIFDSHLPDAKTLHHALLAMRGYRGPWVLLPGNHDAADASDLWSRLADMAGDVDLQLALEAEPMMLAGGAMAILPAPLRRRHGFADPTDWMNEVTTPSSMCRIGLAHGSVRDFGGDDRQPNLIAPDRAKLAKLDYLALGDWHGTLSIDSRTWYAGTPEIDDFPNNQPGHALLVELDGPGTEPRVEKIATSTFNWRKLRLEGVVDADAVISQVERELDTVRPDKLLLALSLAGSVDLSGRSAISAKLLEWQARLAHLRVDDNLRDRPSDDDLSVLARGSGVVAASARRLLECEGDADARLALRYLFDLSVGEGN